MEKNMLIAFLLNLAFSVFELAGSVLTGSVAIASDAIHDLGDAITIGISCLLEKKSKRQADEEYTYGYGRYSVLAGFFSTLVLLLGSALVILGAIRRIVHPQAINYNSMIWFAVAGVAVNAFAALVTREGDSVNQKAVNLHMLEDVLGWFVVLIGAITMKFTNVVFIDPLMSIGVAIFILVNASKNLKRSINLFLEKAPDTISAEQIKAILMKTEGILDIHHIHLWSIDENNHSATMHIVTDADSHEIKETIRSLLRQNGITHITLELETHEEHCHEKSCILAPSILPHHHHH